jgi:hypothetical protein
MIVKSPVPNSWQACQGVFCAWAQATSSRLTTQSGPPKSLRQGSPFRQVGYAQDGVGVNSSHWPVVS